jgi:hypothetical protein
MERPSGHATAASARTDQTGEASELDVFGRTTLQWGSDVTMAWDEGIMPRYETGWSCLLPKARAVPPC